jgi:simple sugar transport system permease protein
MILMTPRKDISMQRTVLTPVFSVLLTLCVGAGIFAVLGYDPSAALYQFFVAPLSRPDQVADLFVKACPLIIIATGLAFCYRANVWNIGAEGQIVMGAVCAGGVALFFPAIPDLLMMPAMIIAAMAGGMALAFIPGILKTRFNTNEILVSLMLTYVAALFIDWLVRGPWRDPESFRLSADQILWGRGIDPACRAAGHWHYWSIALGRCGGVAVSGRCLFCDVKDGVWFSGKGDGGCTACRQIFRLQPGPDNPWCFVLSGACAGVAGMVEVSANMGQLQPEVSFGYGFTAIIVAFLARLNPLGVIMAGLVVALAELGGDRAQMALGMPKVVTGLFTGILLFLLLAGETFNRYHVQINWPRFGQLKSGQLKSG